MCGGALAQGLWPKLEKLLSDICKEDPYDQLDFGEEPTVPPVAVQVGIHPERAAAIGDP